MASVTVPSTGPSGPVDPHRPRRGDGDLRRRAVRRGVRVSANHRATRSPRSAGPTDASVGSSAAAAKPAEVLLAPARVARSVHDTGQRRRVHRGSGVGGRSAPARRWHVGQERRRHRALGRPERRAGRPVPRRRGRARRRRSARRAAARRDAGGEPTRRGTGVVRAGDVARRRPGSAGSACGCRPTAARAAADPATTGAPRRPRGRAGRPAVRHRLPCDHPRPGG